jgi:hypothetical protein
MAKTLGFVDVEEMVVLKDCECTIDMENARSPLVSPAPELHDIAADDPNGLLYRHPRSGTEYPPRPHTKRMGGVPRISD